MKITITEIRGQAIQFDVITYDKNKKASYGTLRVNPRTQVTFTADEISPDMVAAVRQKKIILTSEDTTSSSLGSSSSGFSSSD